MSEQGAGIGTVPRRLIGRLVALAGIFFGLSVGGFGGSGAR